MTTDIAMLFLELQPEIVPSSATIPPDTLRRNAGLARAAAADLDLAFLASAFPLGPDAAPTLIDELAGIEPVVRTAFGAFDHAPLRDRIAAAGSRRLAIGGISSEIAILHTALGARRAGLDVDILVDCCGGLSERTEGAAFRQIEQAGGRLSSLSSFLTSAVIDHADPRGEAAMRRIGELWGWGAAAG